MPPNEPAESIVPAKNAQVLRQVRQVHVRELVARIVFAPFERLGDDADVRCLLVAQPAVAFEDAVHEAAHHVRMRLGEAAVHREHVGDDQQVAVRDQHLGFAVRLLDDLIGARRPADAAVQARLRAAELVLVGIAGDERVFVEHQAELARRRARIEVAQHHDRQAGFLREIADEELALVELRGGEHLAGELVHRGDAAIDDDHVGAARVADLHRHDCFELAAEHRERVGRRRGGREPAVVERRPGLALAHGDLHLEAVLLGEERIRDSAPGRRSRRSGRRSRRIR